MNSYVKYTFLLLWTIQIAASTQLTTSPSRKSIAMKTPLTKIASSPVPLYTHTLNPTIFLSRHHTESSSTLHRTATDAQPSSFKSIFHPTTTNEESKTIYVKVTEKGIRTISDSSIVTLPSTSFDMRTVSFRTTSSLQPPTPSPSIAVSVSVTSSSVELPHLKPVASHEWLTSTSGGVSVLVIIGLLTFIVIVLLVLLLCRGSGRRKQPCKFGYGPDLHMEEEIGNVNLGEIDNAGSDPIDLPPPLLDDGIVETNKDPADSTVHPSRDTSQPIILQDNENLI